MSEIARYGSWPSPLSSERVVQGALRLSQPQLEAGRVFWLEGRPQEGGRQVVMAVRVGGEPDACTPGDCNVRSRVHEYGGGDYLASHGHLFYCDFQSQQLCGPGGPFGEPDCRYAEPVLSPDGSWLVAVEEDHRGSGEPANRLVSFRLRDGVRREVVTGFDFVSSACFAPDGQRLAALGWSHPDMPWDATTLLEVAWTSDGPESPPRVLAGGRDESIFQPAFSPGGLLTFVSDRSGWWNLYRWRDGEAVPLCPLEAEFGRPQWVFGLSSYAHLDDDSILCRFGRGGVDRLAHLHVPTGALDELSTPYTWIDGVRARDGEACFLAGSPTCAPELVHLELASGRRRVLRRSAAVPLEPAWVSEPEAIEFESEGGRRVHAFFYPPRNPTVRAPDDERPPLLVKSHGGPTAATSAVLDPRIQYWTSRGFAVVDVNYTGSTGYGRAYRQALQGRWGVADVEDCVRAALFLAASGRVDRARLAISGGSAGGYTTLCALTFHDVFAAGASHYGIGDLEALVRDTHKFEARYLDRLVAPYPEGAEIYRARSPIHFCEQLTCPVIFFQGLEDRVVPPSQAEAMVAALARRGIPHAYVPFEGEQHGFRKAENIRMALDGELAFYARVFGFEVDVPPDARRVAGG